MIKNFHTYNESLINESNKNLKYRFKTEKEFIKEYGEKWREITGWRYSDNEMDYLLGTPLGYDFSYYDIQIPARPNSSRSVWIIKKCMLVPLIPNYNPKKIDRTLESVRDKMTPKSKEEILTSLSRLSPYNKITTGTLQDIPEIVEQGFKEIDKDRLKKSDVLHYIETAIDNRNVEIIKLFLDNGDVEYPLNSYLVQSIQKYQNLDMVKLFHEYGADLDYLMRFTNILDRHITSSDKPVELIRYLTDNNPNIKSYIVQKYKQYNRLSRLYGNYVDDKVTESVRDKMTPKSESEIKQCILKKYNIKPEITDYLNGLGYEFAQAHETAWKDRWRTTIRFRNESENKNFYFIPGESLENIKKKMER